MWERHLPFCALSDKGNGQGDARAVCDAEPIPSGIGETACRQIRRVTPIAHAIGSAFNVPAEPIPSGIGETARRQIRRVTPIAHAIGSAVRSRVAGVAMREPA